MSFQEHEIYTCSSSSSQLVFTGGELKIKENSSSTGFGVRVLKDSKIGFAYCQNANEIKKAISDAGQAAKFSTASSFSFAPRSNPLQLNDIFDKSLDPNDTGLLKEFVTSAREAAESLKGKSRVIASIGQDKHSIENTSNFSGSYNSTGLSIYVESMLDDGFGFSHIFSHTKPTVDQVSSVASKAANMASDLRDAKKVAPGLYSVVVEIEALESFTEILLASFSGDWKRRNITRLQESKKAFSALLSIYDDPLTHGSSARPFDGEGSPSRKKALVEDGVVKSFLYDRETAFLSGFSDNTDIAGKCGSCSRSSFDSLPAISPSNTLIKSGDFTDLGEVGAHMELHSAHGSHTANLTTGDFGLEVSAAFMVEKEGRIRKPVRGFMITGNIFDLFANLIGVEKKQTIYGSLISPRIGFGKVRVVS